jgi:hypothetical protein
MGQNNESSPRPFSVNLEKFAENFDLIFGKKEKETESEPIPFAGYINIGESKDE